MCAMTHAPNSPMPVIIAGKVALPNELVTVTRVDGEASLDAFNSIIRPNAVNPTNPASQEFLRADDLSAIRASQRGRVERLATEATLPRQRQQLQEMVKVRSGELLGDFTSGPLTDEDSTTLQQAEVTAMAINAGFTNSAVIGVDGFDLHKDGEGQRTQCQRVALLLTSVRKLLETVRPDVRARLHILITSEFARSTYGQENATYGKDHWPWGSAIVVVPEDTGGIVVGATTAAQTGMRLAKYSLDPVDGDDGFHLKVEHVHQFVRERVGVDPELDLQYSLDVPEDERISNRLGEVR